MTQSALLLLLLVANVDAGSLDAAEAAELLPCRTILGTGNDYLVESDLELRRYMAPRKAKKQHAVLRHIAKGNDVEILTIWSPTPPDDKPTFSYFRTALRRGAPDDVFDVELTRYSRTGDTRTPGLSLQSTTAYAVPWHTVKNIVDAWKAALYAARYDQPMRVGVHGTWHYFIGDQLCGHAWSPNPSLVPGKLVAIVKLLREYERQPSEQRSRTEQAIQALSKSVQEQAVTRYTP